MTKHVSVLIITEIAVVARCAPINNVGVENIGFASYTGSHQMCSCESSNKKLMLLGTANFLFKTKGIFSKGNNRLERRHHRRLRRPTPAVFFQSF